jgi:tetratricopeptide (TPR) repeat protein
MVDRQRWMRWRRAPQTGSDAEIADLIRSDERGSATGAFRLGFLLQETGKMAEAEAVYRRAVERGSENAANNLTVMLRRRGDHAGAQEIEQQIARAAGRGATEAIVAEADRRGIPTFQVDSAEDLIIGMAKVEHQQGRPARAEELLRQVLATGRRAQGLAALDLGILLARIIRRPGSPARSASPTSSSCAVSTIRPAPGTSSSSNPAIANTLRWPPRG